MGKLMPKAKHRVVQGKSSGFVDGPRDGEVCCFFHILTLQHAMHVDCLAGLLDCLK